MCPKRRVVPLSTSISDRKLPYPPQEHAWDGAQLAIRNSDFHRSSAEILAAHQKYGAAVSHLVLATEEAIKSLSFLMAAIGLPLPPEDARKILTNHKARHMLAVACHVINDFVARSPVPGTLLAHEGVPGPDLMMTTVWELLGGWSSYVSGSHDPEFEGDIGWWETANSLKQAGMYVDYTAAGWETPLEIGQSAYESSAAVVTRFFESFEKPLRPWVEADPEVRDALVQWLAPIVATLNAGDAERLGELFLSSTTQATAGAAVDGGPGGTPRS